MCEKSIIEEIIEEIPKTNRSAMSPKEKSDFFDLVQAFRNGRHGG